MKRRFGFVWLAAAVGFAVASLTFAETVRPARGPGVENKASGADIAGPKQSLRAVQVFVALSQRSGEAAWTQYVRDHAGMLVDGGGQVEAVLPRAYFDTSVPHTNPVVAIIHVTPGRKLVCGIPQVLSREQLKEFHEGAPVTFRGELVDAHDWGEWDTLYLGNCSLHRR